MPDIGAFLWPNAVAVIGASADESILRGRIMYVMLQHKFKGNVYPISRSSDEIFGLKTYATIEDVPERVDHSGLTGQSAVRTCLSNGIERRARGPDAQHECPAPDRTRRSKPGCVGRKHVAAAIVSSGSGRKRASRRSVRRSPSSDPSMKQPRMALRVAVSAPS